MFGKKKVESVFEVEENLSHELQGAREQLAEVTAKIAAADIAYKQAASGALASGDDTGALKLRREIEKLQVRRDGLDAKISGVEPEYQAASKAAQAERLVINEQARRDRFEKLIGEAEKMAMTFRTEFERFMQVVSGYDDLRERLAVTEFGNEGFAEIEKLHSATFIHHPSGLVGGLLANGWRQRINSKVRPTSLQVTSLVAPPGK